MYHYIDKNNCPLRIYRINDFLSYKCCQYLCNFYESMNHQQMSNSSRGSNFRNHSELLLRNYQNNKIIQYISRKISKYFKININQLECPKITKYKYGEFFKNHIDPLKSNDTNSNRICTFLIYLNTIPEGEGGEIVFTSLPSYNYKNNNIFENKYTTLKIRPITGSILIFFPYYLKNSIYVNYNSKNCVKELVYEALPITCKNTYKYIYQQWIWSNANDIPKNKKFF